MLLSESQAAEVADCIEELVRSGNAELLRDATPEVVMECALRYIERRMQHRTRANSRTREQFEKTNVESKEAYLASARTVVLGMARVLRPEWSEAMLAEKFAVPGGRPVSFADATIDQHERRAQFLEGLATGNLETAAIHRRAISDIRDAQVICLAEVIR
jgi:hypothetical protein